jgi:hypothetical protein
VSKLYLVLIVFGVLVTLVWISTTAGGFVRHAAASPCRTGTTFPSLEGTAADGDIRALRRVADPRLRLATIFASSPTTQA